MRDDRSYKDFADAMFELKKANYDISYGRIAHKTGLLEATVNALANRRRANPPSEDVMLKIAECFNVKPEYFYEWRLTKFLKFLDENRDFLDHCEKLKKNYQPQSEAKKERQPEDNQDTQKQASA